MQDPPGRRRLLLGAGSVLMAGALPGHAAPAPAAASAGIKPGFQPAAALAPVHASPDRITAITVCTRPFRAAGPRLDVESIGRKTVVHNYGHGGSGWSLSWGSGTIAMEKALGHTEREIAVIGCGALGLTTALLLQRAGAAVTIYAKELPPDVFSSNATGVWSPDSRICMQDQATPAFKDLWQRMARTSFQTYQTLMGLPGDPVEFIDFYSLHDDTPPAAFAPSRAVAAPAARPPFAALEWELLQDLNPRYEELDPAQHPFAVSKARHGPLMMFNLRTYQRLLMEDFQLNGGKVVIEEFHSPADFARLPQKVLVNCTGFGARALLGDTSVIPVRGQLAHLIPQPEVRYGLQYHDVFFVPRRDGLVCQVAGEDDYYGYDDDNTTPDRAEAEFAVNTVAGLFRRDA